MPIREFRHGELFRWDDPPGRRAQLRAELGACYARLYGLTRDELRYILDPKEVYGEDFPGETLPRVHPRMMHGFICDQRCPNRYFDSLLSNISIRLRPGQL